MTAITCDKCGRRFTPAVEELQSYLVASKGKKHVLVACPHCGRGNKVSPERLRQAAHVPDRVPTHSDPAIPVDQPVEETKEAS